VARGVPVRIGSRSGVPPFDWEDQATWVPVLQGVESAYITYYPDLAVPGAADVVGALAKLAVAHGVRRMVLLAGRGEDGALLGERAIQDSGVDWTIVRSSWFSQNFIEYFLLDSILSGEVALPVGNVAEPFVDAGDIADVAVAALTEDGHSGNVYEVTGPRLLTFAEAVTEIAQATGREICFRPVAIDEYASMLAQLDVPPVFVRLLTHLFTEVMDGRNAQTKDGVEQALGRMPRDFGDFVRETAASGIWAADNDDRAPRAA
jgi:uncharacterized protein YbjT (DUF2867 family)